MRPKHRFITMRHFSARAAGSGTTKKQTGPDSHRSRLNPYWHLYMKQTYQYPFVA